MISTGILASSCAGGKARDLQLVPVCGLFLNLREAFSPRNANSYSGGFNPGDEIQAVMLAAISASRALRSSACRLDPGFSLLAVSLSLIASKANRSSNGCSCPTRRRPDIGPSVAPCSQHSYSPGVVPNSKRDHC